MIILAVDDDLLLLLGIVLLSIDSVVVLKVDGSLAVEDLTEDFSVILYYDKSTFDGFASIVLNLRYFCGFFVSFSNY